MNVVDLDFFSVLAKPSSLVKVCAAGFTLASTLGSSLRDERVKYMETSAVQIASEPLMVFAVVDRAFLAEALAEYGVDICLNSSDEVLCAEGRLHVDSEVLTDALILAGCESVILYQFGLKSSRPNYWNLIHELASDFPDCHENVFHVSRNFDGIAEDGVGNVCLFKSQKAVGFRACHDFPLFKHLGKGFGSCIVDKLVGNVKMTFYPRIVHVLKRHRIGSTKIPTNVQAARTFLQNLKGLRSQFGGNERDKLHGYRMELQCLGNSPFSCYENNKELLDPEYWVMSGAVAAHTVEVDQVLDMIDQALEHFQGLGVAVGDNSKSRFSMFRKYICTDLLNLFGLCKATMVPYLTNSGFKEPKHMVPNAHLALRTATARKQKKQNQDPKDQKSILKAI